MAERWVVFGLAPARAAWFAELSRWATSGSVPIEFVKHQSAEELRASLAAGRPVSAALVDGSSQSVDRDLLVNAAAAGCPVVVVGPAGRDWGALGAAAALGDPFDPGQLLDVLVAIAAPVGEVDHVPGDAAPALPDRAPGRLIAVCGPGGTGASTVAVALAEGLATPIGARRRRVTPELGGPADVVLADLRRNAEQGMLHDTRDVLLGVEELVELHRAANPPPGRVRELTIAVPERGYDLLVGLRRSRAWATVRPQAFIAALAGLRTAYGTVVADVDADVEGETEGGSRDVEERNAMARTTMLDADGVLVVGAPGLKGAHALVRVLHDLAGLGVEPERLVPVVARAPRGAAARAELTAAIAALAGLATDRPHPTVFLPERKVDEAFRDGTPMPADLTSTLSTVVEGLLRRHGANAASAPGAAAKRVAPGSLGALASVAASEPGEGWDSW